METDAVLFDATPSMPLILVREAVFVIVLPLVPDFGFATISKFATCSPVRFPTFHTPEELLYVPWLGVADTKVKSDGSLSVIWILPAAFALLLEACTVKVTFSPTFTEFLLTVLVTAISFTL